ncbi:MAG TPA: M48 family metallopeptidase [Alphaproteobacteria bacterium]|nr:M48 family metallopeptidase [Alphaproteobacteria bacterium]
MTDRAPEHWDGRYNDGLVAAAYVVRVAVSARDLEIRGAEGQTHTSWPLDEVRFIERGGAHDHLRLARAEHPDRLTITTPGALAALERLCPALRKIAYKGPSWRAVAIGSAAALASFAFVFFVLLPLLARQAADWVSPELEAHLGNETANAIISIVSRLDDLKTKSETDQSAKVKSRECRASQGIAALKQLAGPIEAQLHVSIPVRIRVVNSPILNAMALPGGQILVFRGLIDFVKTPNEFAGVMAHEMAHIELHHPIEIAIERSANAFLVGLVLGDVFGGSAMAGMGQAMISARYSRDAERAADARGIMLLEGASLNPGPFAQFFKRLLEREGAYSDVASFLASHPATEERARLAALAPAEGRTALGDKDWKALKAICD